MTDPIQTTELIAYIITIILGYGIGIIGLALGKLVSPRKSYPLKEERYECGNKPYGRARGWFAMQYYGYLIVFLTVEPIVIYLFFILIAAHETLNTVIILFLLILGILTPPLIYGLKVSEMVKLWTVRED